MTDLFRGNIKYRVSVLLYDNLDIVVGPFNSYLYSP